MSDMLAAYGSGVLDLPFETYYKLLLNLPRVRLQRAIEFALGRHASMSRDPLGREWADALASCDEEVDEIDYQMRESRKEAKLRDKRGW